MLRETLASLLMAAVNPALYEKTGHGKVRLERDCRRILGDFCDPLSPDGIIRR